MPSATKKAPSPPDSAPRIVAGLTLDHHRMLVDGSGIAPAVIVERGYVSIPEEGHGYDWLRQHGFSKVQAKCRPGLALPLHAADGQQPLMVYRPNHPRRGTDGRPLKYEIPQGSSVRLDCPPRCQPFLGDPNISIWITEGQKKADCLASLGAIAICLLGVWNFKGKNVLGGKTFLADWDYVTLPGREVRLVFDSDVTSKVDVRKALERLTEHLTRKGASVRQVYLPPIAGKKIGVDDFIADGHTLEDLENLIEAPRPQPQPAPIQVELLDTAPACIRRPLTCIDGRTYAAIWPHVKVTRTEALDKHGNVVRLATPEVTTQQRLLIVRDDGVLFGEGGEHPLADLGLEVHLPEIPTADKLWTVPSVRAYRDGKRPDPAQIFKNVVEVIETFLDFNRSLADQQTMCELVACYIFATWFLEAFPVIGYLWPNGEAGSGKTKMLTLVTELGYLGQLILAGSSYACLRDFADYGATLGFDDAETVMDFKRGDPEKRALLLAGNRRGNTIAVKEAISGKEWRTRHVQTFCPRLFSAIRLPDPVLASRSIILPLIRTANAAKANADPLDYHLWPTPRHDLVNAMWALALSNCSIIDKHNGAVLETTTLLGRSLEPWRAILAIAHWLTDCGVTDLGTRMTALSLAYQSERPDLEPPDLTALTIRALLHYSVSSVSSVSAETSDTAEIDFATATITELVKQLVEEQELNFNADQVTTRRIGRVFGRMRFREKPRSGSGGKRQWVCTKGDLRRLLVSYGVPWPKTIFSDEVPLSTNGANGAHGANGANFPDEIPLLTNGANGAHGANGAENTERAAGAVVPPCANCGGVERWVDQYGFYRCVHCMPRGQVAS